MPTPWYSYAANSPLSFSDPLGLKPLSDAELQAYTDAHTGWNRVGQWISDNKDYIAGAAMLIGGGILTACGAEPLGPMFIGAGVDAIIQRATTGHTSYGQVALSGMLGMVGEVAGAARAAQLGWHGLRATMLIGASSGAASGAGASGYAYMTGPAPTPWGDSSAIPSPAAWEENSRAGLSPLLDTGWRVAPPISPDTMSWPTRQFSPGTAEYREATPRHSPCRRGRIFDSILLMESRSVTSWETR